MRKYVVPEHSLTADIADADPVLSEAWAREFIEDYIGCKITELSLEFCARFIVVFRYHGRTSEREQTGGWIITGNMPLLSLSDEEITTPLEALAIYSYFLIPWLDAKGDVGGAGCLPDYRVPPEWQRLALNGSYEKSRIDAITGFIEWKLIDANEDEIVHPDIREYCYRRGWLSRPEPAETT